MGNLCTAKNQDHDIDLLDKKLKTSAAGLKLDGELSNSMVREAVNKADPVV